MTMKDSINNDINLCQCGCGQPTKFYRKKPNRFINGHCHRGDYHHNWKDGKYFINGYLLVMRRNHPHANSRGYVYEHRLVMEQHLGRYLRKDEVVHHINKVKTDNRIENLQLFESNSEHLKHEHEKAGKYWKKV